jgi:hypothetical protein
LEKIEKTTDAFVNDICDIIIQIPSLKIQNNNNNNNNELDDEDYELIESLFDKVLDYKTNDISTIGRIIAAIISVPLTDSYMGIIGLKFRDKRVSRLLEMWNIIVVIRNNKDIDVNIEPFHLPETYSGGFRFGSSPETIENKEIKKNYEEYLKKRDDLLKSKINYNQACIIKKFYEKKIAEYIIDSYSIRPFATSELEKLLQDNKVDVTFAKEILDAVKKKVTVHE